MLPLELCGIFLGVLARVFFPWVRKLRSGEAAHFSKRYLYSAIGSVIAGMIVTVLIFPKLDVASMGKEQKVPFGCLPWRLDSDLVGMPWWMRLPSGPVHLRMVAKNDGQEA